MLVDQRNWESKREKIGKITAVVNLFPEEHTSLSKKLAKKTAVRLSVTHPDQLYV
jgi:U3 small nucleolar RNA-associated protein 25